MINSVKNSKLVTYFNSSLYLLSFLGTIPFPFILFLLWFLLWLLRLIPL